MILDSPIGPARGAQFSVWLLRPYVDLQPLVEGPLYARGIDEYWTAFKDPQGPAFYLQRTLPPTFRRQLIDEARLPEYLVTDPRELPGSLRSNRWAQLCDALNNWQELPDARRCRLTLLLHSLCLYAPVLQLVAEFDRRSCLENPATVELAYWRASARYVLGLPKRIGDYHAADMSVFEAIALEAPDTTHARFNAAIKVMVHKAKTGAEADELAKWGDRAERALANAVSQVDTFTGHLLTSRFHRAMGFLPMRLGDAKQMIREMDLAEQSAVAMKPATIAEELLYLENLHPVLESRTKEALWLGDQDLALERAQKVVKLDPYDSKAWVELGEVRMKRQEWKQAAESYVAAAMLGPPASAIGRHMAGVCFRECGQDWMAAFFFADALRVDPLGISPHSEIHELPDNLISKGLREWSLRTREL